jgi:hypothetical protein
MRGIERGVPDRISPREMGRLVPIEVVDGQSVPFTDFAGDRRLAAVGRSTKPDDIGQPWLEVIGIEH